MERRGRGGEERRDNREATHTHTHKIPARRGNEGMRGGVWEEERERERGREGEGEGERNKGIKREREKDRKKKTNTCPQRGRLGD